MKREVFSNDKIVNFHVEQFYTFKLLPYQYVSKHVSPYEGIRSELVGSVYFDP